jgi:hypothetical protein
MRSPCPPHSLFDELMSLHRTFDRPGARVQPDTASCITRLVKHLPTCTTSTPTLQITMSTCSAQPSGPSDRDRQSGSKAHTHTHTHTHTTDYANVDIIKLSATQDLFPGRNTDIIISKARCLCVFARVSFSVFSLSLYISVLYICFLFSLNIYILLSLYL